MTSKRHSRCFVLALVPDASARTRLQSLAYINAPLSTYCKIRCVEIYSGITGSPCDSMAFLLTVATVRLKRWGNSTSFPFLRLLSLPLSFPAFRFLPSPSLPLPSPLEVASLYTARGSLYDSMTVTYPAGSGAEPQRK